MSEYVGKHRSQATLVHDGEPFIPRPILTTLFRGLVWNLGAISREDISEAWAWLEAHNHYEEMGQ